MSDFTATVGLLGVQDLFEGKADGLIEAAIMADQAGIDQIALTDHVIMGVNTDKYPYGEFPIALDAPWYEPMTLLSVIAGATKNIRLSTGILISPLRSAALLAKTAATLDGVSGGRLELGVGTGWQREEYDACGVSFDNRIGRLEDQIQAMRILWRDAPASFFSETVNFENIYCMPFPVQAGGIPLWLGMAPGPRAIKLLVDNCVGWLPMPMPLEELKVKIDVLRAAFLKAGRDPGSLRVRAQPQVVLDKNGLGDLDRTLDRLESSLEAGITDVQFLTGSFVRDREKLPEYFSKIVERRS